MTANTIRTHPRPNSAPVAEKVRVAPVYPVRGFEESGRYDLFYDVEILYEEHDTQWVARSSLLNTAKKIAETKAAKLNIPVEVYE